MKPKITFDTKVVHDNDLFGNTNGKKFQNFYVRVEALGAGLNAWTNLILEQCQRVRDLNGVTCISCRTGVQLGRDACELHVKIEPMISVNGTYICPVPSQLFQAIIVSVNEADRLHKQCYETMNKITANLAELEKSMLAAAKTSKETKV